MDETPEKQTREDLELEAFKARRATEALAEMIETEGWKLLNSWFNEYRAAYYQQLTRSLMRGRDIDQRKLDFNRGVFDGLDQLFEKPTQAKRQLDKIIERLKQLDEAGDDKE